MGTYWRWLYTPGSSLNRAYARLWRGVKRRRGLTGVFE
jgi:hypothetical protein